jgi:hypothetical protein
MEFVVICPQSQEERGNALNSHIKSSEETAAATRKSVFVFFFSSFFLHTARAVRSPSEGIAWQRNFPISGCGDWSFALTHSSNLSALSTISMPPIQPTSYVIFLLLGITISFVSFFLFFCFLFDSYETILVIYSHPAAFFLNQSIAQGSASSTEFLWITYH